jgi:hypothetical protein
MQRYTLYCKYARELKEKYCKNAINRDFPTEKMIQSKRRTPSRGLTVIYR